MLLIYVASLGTRVGILTKLRAEKIRKYRAISESEK